MHFLSDLTSNLHNMHINQNNCCANIVHNLNWRSFGDSSRPRKTHLGANGGCLSTVVANGWQALATHSLTPVLASLRLPVLPRTRFGVNGLGMRRVTILESGVVIRFEFFELQPFKVDQFFCRFFRDFPTLITLKYIQK